MKNIFSLRRKQTKISTKKYIMDYESKLDKVKHMNSEIIVYCRFGGRSELACELLTENGFSKIYNMMGSILAWIEGEFPVYLFGIILLLKIGERLKLHQLYWKN